MKSAQTLFLLIFLTTPTYSQGQDVDSKTLLLAEIEAAAEQVSAFDGRTVSEDDELEDQQQAFLTTVTELRSKIDIYLKEEDDTEKDDGEAVDETAGETDEPEDREDKNEVARAFNALLLEAHGAKATSTDGLFDDDFLLLSGLPLYQTLILEEPSLDLAHVAHLAGTDAGFDHPAYFNDIAPRVTSALQLEAFILGMFEAEFDKLNYYALALKVTNEWQLGAFRLGAEAGSTWAPYFNKAIRIRSERQFKAFKWGIEAVFSPSDDRYFASALKVTTDQQLAQFKAALNAGNRYFATYEGIVSRNKP